MQQALQQSGYKISSTVNVETRFRYNPDIKSLPAMAPAFVQLPIAPAAPALGDIRIEIQRGNTAIKVDWPVQASDDCAAWLRDWLR